MATMSAAYRSWPPAARAMAGTIDDAVTAARAGDADAFADAEAALSQLDAEQVRTVLGEMTRDLVERSFPDGLDAEDAELLLQGAIRFSAAWYPALDSDSLIRALTGSLGGSEPEDDVSISPRAVVAHGLLLIGERLSALALELPPVLNGALAELMRAQTV